MLPLDSIYVREKCKALRPSAYNRYIAKNNVNLVFNSCSLSLIKLDENKYISLKNGVFDSFADKELQHLYEMNFITSVTDESRIVMGHRFSYIHPNDILRLTIFTTTKCNARCPYCFQKGIKQEEPTNCVEQELIDLILRNKDKRIYINWFGGEPLLNSGMIDRMSKKLSLLGINYSSSMISNGYLINENILKLPTWKLKRIQITLDGINEKYNSIKRYVSHNVSNPFETVISGIKNLLKIGVFVSIRLNFDKNNYMDIIDCINYLHNTFGNPPNFLVYCHHVFGSETGYHLSDGTNIYLILMKELMKYGYIKNLFQLGIRYRPIPCAAYNPNFYVIDVKGKLLKCEHYVSDSAYVGFVGNLKKGVVNKRNIDFWLDKNYPYKNCIDCDILPICQGGCKFESMKDDLNGACLPYKDCIDDLLYEYYILKTQNQLDV